MLRFVLETRVLALAVIQYFAITGCNALNQSKLSGSENSAQGIRLSRMIVRQNMRFTNQDGTSGFQNNEWIVPLSLCADPVPGLAFRDCTSFVEKMVAAEWKMQTNVVPMLHTLPIPERVESGNVKPLFSYTCVLSEVFVEANKILLKEAKTLQFEYFDLVFGPFAQGKMFAESEVYQVSEAPLREGTSILGLRFLAVTGCHYPEQPQIFSRARVSLSYMLGAQKFRWPEKDSDLQLFPAARQSGFEWSVYDVPGLKSEKEP